MVRDYDYWYNRIQSGYDIRLSNKYRKMTREIIDRVGGPNAHPPDITTVIKQYLLPEFIHVSPMARIIFESTRKMELRQWHFMRKN